MIERAGVASLLGLWVMSCGPTPPAATSPGPVIAGAPAGPGSGDDPVTPAAEGGPVADPAAGVDTGPPASGLPPAARAILDAHNQFRARHCAPPLTWSAEVAAVAQSWANQLLDAGCAFEHSQSSRYGENLFFYGPAGGASGADAVADWYGEVASYDFGHPGFAMDTGHFTQVVWRGTRELGCGMARCSGGDIWVCNYSPPGNVLTQFGDNVLPTSCR